MNQIGVIIPVYNGEKTIEKSISSLLQQTYTDWLAIIIDDGSTDNTKSILNKYSGRKQFHIVHFNKNRGRPYARQEGLEILKNKKLKYMCMLDADDWYYPDKLRHQFEIMECNHDLTLVSSAIGVTNGEFDLFKVIKPFLKFKRLYFSNFKYFIKLPHASSIIRVANIEKNINYNVKLKLSQDQDFLRQLLVNKTYAFDPKVQYIYNREDSFSLYKYRMSMHYNFISFKNLNLGTKANIAYFINNRIKYIIVWILSLLNLKSIYMSRVGLSPTYSEKLQFEENKRKLF